MLRIQKIYLLLTVIFCLVFIGSLVLAFYGIPLVIKQSIKKNVRLEEGSDQYERFLNVPIPIIFNVYLFSVENYEDVLNGEIPIVKENGPYAYKQTIEREINSTDSENDTLEYKETLYLEFSAEDSEGHSDDEELLVLNPVVVGVLQTIEDWKKQGLKNYVDQLFPSPGMPNSLFLKAKVKDLLFDGVPFAGDDSCTDWVCKVALALVKQQASPLKNIDDTRTGNLYFSYFKYKNGTKKALEENKAYLTINRGVDDVSKLGTILQWNKNHSLNLYGGVNSTDDDKCNLLQGTDNTIYPPYLTDADSLVIFNTDLCRMVEIDYQGTGSVQDIEGRIFGTNKNTFRPSTETAEEDCYCVQETLDEDGEPNCYLDGVIDVLPCIGTPFLASWPHFMWADEKYAKGVVGMAPDVEKHKTFINLEPNTGTPLEGAKRVQMNMVLRPDSAFDFSTNLPRTIIPVIWVSETVALTDEFADLLKDQYLNVVKMTDIVKYCLIGVTALLSIVFLSLFIRHRIVNKK